ncbi:unnamed protein product [Coffea canephora]|uniref:Uncharacterized protein n=1 Tax=Coffea canephora TaxID=49390 RepID=A0A068UFJ0_COFCA|nr:unnamed protein product [Coffea canephora]
MYLECITACSVFNHLLDDSPLPVNEASSSVLVATFSSTHSLNGKGSTGGGKLSGNVLSYYFQVCDPNGRWYLADSGFVPGDLLFLTGKALIHATTGLSPTASHRSALDIPPGTSSGGKTSLVFRLMPQGNAILDCSPIAVVGHVIL